MTSTLCRGTSVEGLAVPLGVERGTDARRGILLPAILDGSDPRLNRSIRGRGG